MASKKPNKKAEQKPVRSDPQELAMPVLKRILSENFSLYRNSYILAIICMVIIAATTAYSAYIIKDVVNKVFDDKNLGAAYTIAGIILLVFFTKGMANFGQEVLLNRIGNNIIARYQNRVFEHMLSLGVGFYTHTRSAYLVGQINQNISGVRNMLNQIITVFARDLLTLIGLVGVMVWQDPLMSFGSLIVMPIAGFVISRYVKQIKTLAKRGVNVNAQVNSMMVETAQGIPVVKAYTMEEQLQDKIKVHVKSAEKNANSMALVTARTKPLTETLGGLAIAGAVAFGGWRVIALDGNPGALLSFLAAAMLAYEPARRLASFRVQFERSLVNARLLYELLDTPPRQADKPKAKNLQISKGEIRIENVTFAYAKGEPVLNDISIVAEAGKTTALVGPSGGGKSTIISLLLRFHDIQSGRISIDGQNLTDLKIASLRRQISYVSQHPVMFEGSVADNIRFGRPDATQEEIEAAAKLAQAHDFISEMKKGYDSPVGETGSNLSGGQRQRISIARAVLRNAPILLLDEATSALDNESEKLVQEALDKLMKGRTTIVVAHRLSTIRHADNILVIDQGRIVESGSHDKLMSSKSGAYAKLHNLGYSTTKANANPSPVKKTAKMPATRKSAKPARRGDT